MEVVELVAKLVSLLIDAVGHEKAQQLISEETQRRANAAADAVAAAREAAGT
jgi:hypothetical protein